MKLNTLIMGSLVACCAGCVVEKVVYVPVVRDDGRNKNLGECEARIVKAFGLDDGYFANTNRFNPKKSSRTSHPVKLEKPFGPFDSVVVKLTDDVPTVVNVSNADRSAATNRCPRLRMECIELAHDYLDRASAERMLNDVSDVLDRLNRAFDSDLSLPKWPAVVEETAAKPRRGDYAYLTENGERPKMLIALNLVDQRITLEAEEGLYGKRGNDVVLLVPPKIRMTVLFKGESFGWENDETISDEIEAVSLGDPIAKRLTFGKERNGWYGFDRNGGRPRYEYNVDTKRLTAVPK